MIRRILVCGCARSGNTLMLHLLDTGFHDTEILYHEEGGEVAPSEQYLKDGKIIVGKFPKKASKLSKWLNNEDLGVVYMMRDPRDVLVSSHWLKPNKYWVQPKRWIETAKIAHEYQNHDRVHVVKYESLLLNSDAVQKEISDKFGMEINHSFEQCYEKFNSDDDVNMNNMNGARPLDTSRIGNWAKDPKKQSYIGRVMKSNPELGQWMQKFNYH